LRQAGLSDI